MTTPAPRRAASGPLARGLALLIALGCFAAIAWTARDRPGEPARPPAAANAAPPAAALLPARPAAAGAAEACLERKRAEIAALQAEGELTAERRMRIRQIEARGCE